MRLRDVIRAIREYPAACSELRQAQQALEQSEQRCRSLELELEKQLRQPFERQFEANAVEEKMTELKLYSPLYGELTEPEYDRPQPMDGRDLAPFQDVILQGIEDEQFVEEAERGLMLYYDGPSAVDEKVLSFFPSVEKVDGVLYAAAVFQIRGTLTPGELEELKEYCRAQYNDAWGEGFAQRPRRTEYGDLYVSFWQDSSATILTKDELEAARIPNRPPRQPKKEWGGHGGR